MNKIFAALGIEISQAQSLSWSCHLPGGNLETLKLGCCWVWVPVVDGAHLSLGIQVRTHPWIIRHSPCSTPLIRGKDLVNETWLLTVECSRILKWE